VIDPTSRPVAMRMKFKKREKNRRLRVTISRMCRHAPFEPIDPNSCMWRGVPDVINCANFFENRSRGLRAGIPRKTAFPIESVHRPYNSVSTTVLHCDNFLTFPLCSIPTVELINVMSITLRAVNIQTSR